MEAGVFASELAREGISKLRDICGRRPCAAISSGNKCGRPPAGLGNCRSLGEQQSVFSGAGDEWSVSWRGRREGVRQSGTTKFPGGRECLRGGFRVLFLEEGGVDARDVAHVMLCVEVVGGFVDEFARAFVIASGFIIETDVEIGEK